MPFKSVVTSEELQSFPEPIRKEYREGTDDEGLKGKFVIQVEPDSESGYAFERVTGLKNTVATLRRERSDLASKLEKFGDLTPDQAMQVQQEVEQLREKLEGSGKSQANIDKAVDAKVAELKTKYEKDNKTLSDQLSQRNRAIEQLVVVNEATQALSELGGNPDFLMHHIINQTRVQWDSDKPSARVVDLKNPEIDRITLQEGTEPMGIRELVKIMADDARFKAAFKGSGAQGSGNNNSASGGSTQPMDVSNMSPEQLISLHHKTKR